MVHQPSGQQCTHSAGGLSTNQGRQCGAYVGAIEKMMSVVCVSVTDRVDIMVMDVFWHRLCKYTVRKGDLFVLSWPRVRRVRRRSISSELLMCGGGVRSILLLPLVARYLETIDVCIWRMFVFMSVVVTV